MNCSKNRCSFERRRKKTVVRDKLNALFLAAPKVLAETSDETPKYEIIISNLGQLFEILEKGITPKELEFFYSVENSKKNCIWLA